MKDSHAQCGPNTIAFVGSQPVYNTACGNNSYQVIGGSTPSGTGNSFRWEVSFSGGAYSTIVNNGGIPVSSSDISKNDITNFVLTPAGNASGDYRIRRIVTNAGAGCSNTSQPVFLYYSQSSATTTGGTVTGNAVSCSPASGNLTVSGNTGPVLRWESAPGSGGPWTTIANNTNTLAYSGLTAGTCYRALIDNICDGTAGSVDAFDKYSTTFCITVNSIPSITVQPLSQDVCIGSGLSLSVTATSTTPMTYQWRKNGFEINGAVSATYSVGVVSNSDAGNYDVVITNDCGQVTSTAAVVTVKPKPIASVPSNTVVCPGASVPGTAFTSSPAGATFTWTNSNTAIGLAASGSGDISSFTATNITTSPITATIVVTPTLNGCTGPSSSYTITVNPTAVVASGAADVTVCAGAIVSASNFVGAPAGTTFTWSSTGDAIGLPAASGSGNVPSFTAVNAGATSLSATITVTPSVNGCTGTPSSYIITVNPLPVIVSAIATNELTCGGNNGTITITATGTAPLMYSIDGGATTQSGGFFNNLTPGSYSVVVSNASGCVATDILTISSPGAPPEPQLSSNNSPVCELDDIIVSVLNPISGATYTWTGPGFTLVETTGTLTRANSNVSMSGNYVVTASVGGCVSPAADFTVVVKRRPVVNTPPDLVFCPGILVPAADFISTPAGATYTWTNSNDAIGLGLSGSGAIPDFTTSNTTNSPITAIITVIPTLNGCTGDAVSYTITVNPNPVVTAKLPVVICHGSTIPEQTFATNVAGSTFSWTVTALGATFSGTGSIPAFPAVNNGVTPIVGIVTVTASSGGCSGPVMTYNITVNPLPRITNAPLNQVTCAGTSTSEVVLTSDVAGATFSWTAVASSDITGFTPVGTGNIPPEMLTNNGTVQGTVTYTIIATANGCSGPATTYVVRVDPLPRLLSSINLSQTICSGSATTAVILSSEVTGTLFNWTATAPGSITGFQPAGTNQTQLPSQTLFNSGSTPQTVTYTIVPISDGCSGPVSTYTITVNPLPTATLSGTATVCYGADATLNVALTGTAPFTITYSDGTSFFTISGINTNSYSFPVSATTTKTYTIASVTDAICTNVGLGIATITQPSAPLAATASVTNVTCFGNNNGSISFTGVSGGSGSYQYSIDGGVNWQAGASFTGLAPGTYNLQLRDAGNLSCTFVVNNALVITQPSAALSAAIGSSTNVLCFGTSTGTASVNVSGGTAPYSYLWSNGATTANLQNVPAGTYTVNVSDANGCSLASVLSVTITQPASALSASANSTNVNCFGGNNGSITLDNTTGGSGNYEYSINGGTSWQAAAVFNNLVAGTYHVLIRDGASASCEYTVNATLAITQPSAPLAATASVTNVTCFGNNNGSISFTGVSGGSGSYQYSIDGGVNWQAGASFTGLAPGTYSLQLRDAGNLSCTFVVNTALVITQPSAVLSAAIGSSTNVLCFGASTGTASVNVSGGTAPYSYLWSNGATTANLQNVPAGTYTVNISDANGCSLGSVLSVTITQPASALSASVNSTNVNCFGGNNGSITLVNTTGGSGNYEYSINGGTSWQAAAVFNSLVAGTYHVLIRDGAASSCVYTVNATLAITQPSAPLDATASATNVTCFGNNNGSISFTGVSGGSGSYQYSIDGGVNWQAGASFTGLAPGTYSLQLRDAGNLMCTLSVNNSLVITQPLAALSAAIGSSTNVLCYGASTGTASINVSGGTAPYSYLWSNGATTANLQNVPAGTYTVNVSDANGCSLGSALTVTIAQPAFALNASANSKNVSCFGGNDGSVTLVDIVGGSGNYEYSINGGTNWQGSPVFNNLTAGTYHVLIRDSQALTCVFSVNTSLIITQPPALTATAVTSDISCFGASDGTITVSNMSGGSGSYQYSIDGGVNWQNGSSFAGLKSGVYAVQMRDAVNTACVFAVNTSLTLNQPAILSAAVEFKHVTCRGSADGVISVINASGGYGNYEFSKDGGLTWQSSSTFTNVAPGSYNVKVRDLVNPACVQTLNTSVVIRQADEPLVSGITSQVNVNCFGSATGSVSLFVRGGVAPYTFSWSNGASSKDLVNVAAGSYTVIIKDSFNCVSTQTITISQPSEPLTINFAKNDVTCFGASNGLISLTVSGGKAPYTYKWDNGRITKDITNLPAGSYTIFVSDANGCSQSQQIIVDQPAQSLFVNVVKTNVTCFGASDGSITLNVTGGALPYSYNWSSGQRTSSLTGVGPGVYSVTIVDANGCSLRETVSIIQPSAPLRMSLAIKNTVCRTSRDGSITATITGGTSPYTVLWNGRSQSSNVISALPAGSYELTVMDANGCKFIANAQVVAGICPPVAIDDSFKIYEGSSATGTTALNDFDRENEKLTFSNSAQAKNGILVFHNDGSFIYTPNPGFLGTETVPYKICNTSGVCSSANLIIRVVPFSTVNLTPEISNVREGKKVSVTARLERVFPDDVIIKIGYSGSAVKDRDYVLLDQFIQIMIPKGQLTTTQKITIAALTDDQNEGDESIIIQILSTSDPEVKIGTGSVVTIGDVYPPEPVEIEKKDAPINRDITVDPLFSPNNDGSGNDVFNIVNIVSFPDNEVIIFNRWGNEVFRIKGYNESDRVFKGYANTGLLANSNTPLVDGVYYYLITTRRTINGAPVNALNKGYLILRR